MQAFQDFMMSRTIYKPDDIRIVVDKVMGSVKKRRSQKIEYFNCPASFDIESTSFIDDAGEKSAIMYEWTFGLNGAVIIGRTWVEFVNMISELCEALQLSKERRLVVYVHNLAFEFQFIRKLFVWEKVFSLETRKPIEALTDSGIDFKCSFLLSGYSLAKIGKDLQKYPVEKLVGDLDYSLCRHTETPLTEKELQYCVNDVKIVMAYIQETIENDGGITKIPLTKTGYVRNFCRNHCFYKDGKVCKGSYQRFNYRELITSMTLTVPEYKQLKRAFQGGYTHANPFRSGEICENVSSDDFTSSYPAVMVAEMFPMSSSEEVKITSRDQFLNCISNYCCLFDVEIIGLRSAFYYDSYLSRSRCIEAVNAVCQNGRVVAADRIFTTMTEQDYLIMRKCYFWKSFRVGNFRRYKKDYLPTDFVKSILMLYEKKTTLKNVEGAEVDYLKSKEMLNSCYGMTVTDIVRDTITYIDKWDAQTPDYETAIDKYNKNSNRFLFFPWGVWVTAYARRNLWSGIIAVGHDYVYSDTDSIKCLNRAKHQPYFDKYNTLITEQLKRACDYHGIEYTAIAPQTKAGKIKPLGVWDFEGTYSRFKTLGAKRYMTEENGKISITVSGLNKRVCVPYLQDRFGNNVFESFNDDLYIPAEFTGKNTHTYIDAEQHGIITDYLGNAAEYHELSSVHLAPADYSLSITQEYANYIKGVKEISHEA